MSKGSRQSADEVTLRVRARESGRRGRRAEALVSSALAAVLLAAAAAAVLRARAGLAAPAVATVGSLAPQFDLPVLGQPTRRVALSTLRGRPVIVVFNCGCKACSDFDRRLAFAAPRLRHAQVVAVTANPSAYEGRKMDQFRRATGFRWPILVDERMEATRRYGANDCPRAWLVGGDGIARLQASRSAAALLAGIEELVPSAQAP